MCWSEKVKKADKLVESTTKGNDSSHDAAHAFRVRDLALSLAHEEAFLLPLNPSILEPSQEIIVENFLEEEGIEESKSKRILQIINRMGIARCFTFGGSRSRVLHDVLPRSDLLKKQYMNKDAVNRFHENLLTLEDLMKTKLRPSLAFTLLIRASTPSY